MRERLIVYQPEHLWEVTERLLHRLVLRTPKATLEILRAYGEDPFRAIFGLEVDCGKLWRRASLGAGVNQPEDPWGGERTAYCLPARAPVGGHRTAASQTSFTDSESDVRDSECVRGGPLQGDFWSRIRLWKAVARGNHCCVRLHCCVRASALLYANSRYLHSYKFATVTAVVRVCTVVS